MNEQILQQLKLESKQKPRQERPNWKQIVRIIKLYETKKHSYNSIARLLNLTPQRVGQIINRHKELFSKEEHA